MVDIFAWPEFEFMQCFIFCTKYFPNKWNSFCVQIHVNYYYYCYFYYCYYYCYYYYYITIIIIIIIKFF